ncbi:MAG: LysM peptidoglycan-binding domain-containing protein [Verrucomicrobia bacterium]|nr:LysM peptidoglycan-binding domain-containing protein [Verrucomicrobiota bacterium]
MDVGNYGRQTVLLAMAILGFLAAGPLFAQLSPGAAEDAEAERRKILKAADQVDRMDSSVEEMKARIAALEKILEDVKQQSNSLKESLASTAAKAEKEKQSLLEEVSKMLAETKAREKSTPAESKPAPREGYEHTVAKGDTLSSIVQAYNKEYGLKLTVESVRKANQLSKDAALKVGQKLLIPSS